jgi:hypothetical protein
MKADIDSIVVIIVSLLFIILGALTRSRKKRRTVQPNIQSRQNSKQPFKDKILLNEKATMISDPFDKLERMFNIYEQTDNQEDESPEFSEVKEEQYYGEPADKARSLEVPVDSEPQSLEVIIDEETEYLREKEISKSAEKKERDFDEMDLTWQAKRTDIKPEDKPKTKIPLFENIDDIKKAVIYSEILNRREY